MQRQAGWIVLGFAFAGLFGADVRGCGGPQPVPPVGTSGGGTGGSSDAGSPIFDGGGCEEPCGSLDEAQCSQRSDCHPVYDEQGCTRTFDHCEALVCPAFMCAVPADCQPVRDPNGCATCQCQQQGCSSDADCPQDQFCSIPDCDGAGDPSRACPPGTSGVCQPRVICPAIACGSPSPTAICTTWTGPDGCPTCSCTDTACSSDSDCGAGQICAPAPCACQDPTSCDCKPAGACILETCATDADCRSGESCQPEACPMDLPSCSDVPPGSEQPCCAGNAGICVATVVTCQTDADCPSGNSCVPDCACPPNAMCLCPSGGTCQPTAGCLSDADCTNGEVCGPNPMACNGYTQPACDPTAPALVCQPPISSHNCGDTDCSADEVCVHWEGGVVDPNGNAYSSWACAAFPAQCQTTAACGCIGNAICGSASLSDCSGGVPTVTCEAP